MTKQAQDKAKQDALEFLKSVGFSPAKKLHCFLTNCSASGLTRIYDVYITSGEDLVRLSHSVARLTGMTYNRKHEGIEVGGYGFSGALQITDCLYHALGIHSDVCRNYEEH